MTDTFCRTKWTKAMYGMGIWSALNHIQCLWFKFWHDCLCTRPSSSVNIDNHTDKTTVLAADDNILRPHTLVTRIQIINNNFNILNLYMSFSGRSNNSYKYSTQWIFWGFNCKTLKMVSVPTTIVWDTTTSYLRLIQSTVLNCLVFSSLYV